MIITVIKLIHSIVFKIFIALLFIILSLFFALTSGITVENLSFADIKISKFHIKLDKKLNVTLKSLDIKKGDSTINKDITLKRVAQIVQYLPNYFNYIFIESIRVGEKRFKLLYKDELLFFDSDSIEFRAKLNFNDDKDILQANIDSLYIKEPKVNITAKLIYDFEKKKWDTQGKYSGLGIDGDFKAILTRDTITFEINSKPCDSIKELVDYFSPKEKIKVWIYPKIPAKRYTLHYLKGKLEFKKDGSVKFDPKNIVALATAESVKVYFNEKLPPVKSKKIYIRLKDNTLSFKPLEPTYKSKKLDGSSIEIRNLTNINAELFAFIKVKSKVDKDILKLLSTYKIELPFIQNEGITDANIKFSIKLANGKLTSYKGKYTSKETKLLFDDTLLIPVKDLNIISEGTTINILNCRVEYWPYLKATLKGGIDLNKKEGKFTVNIDNLKLNYENINIFNAKDIAELIYLDFFEDIKLNISKHQVEIFYKKDGILSIKANKLELLKPYFNGPLLPIEKGDLQIEYNKSAIYTSGYIEYINNFLYRNRKNLNDFNISAKINKQGATATITDQIRLFSNTKGSSVKLNNLDIKLHNLIEFATIFFKDVNNSSEVNNSKKVFIEGANSRISYKSVVIPSDSYKVNITTYPFTAKFKLTHEKGSILGEYRNNNIDVVGKELSSSMMRSITTIDELKGGRFDFNAKGYIDDFNGTIIIEDALWTKSAFYNNLLAALNTIPAILTLKNPGFNPDGFKIKRGVLNYRFMDGRLFLKDIVIKGHSAQITGKGSIDFKTNTSAFKLQIHFLESLTNIISKIPIAGYIIFGKDGTLSVALEVSGPLSNPNIKTKATQGIIKAPLNILERVITLPLKIFE